MLFSNCQPCCINLGAEREGVFVLLHESISLIKILYTQISFLLFLEAVIASTTGTKLICLLWRVVKSEDSPFQSLVTMLVQREQEGKKSNNKDTFLITNAGG